MDVAFSREIQVPVGTTELASIKIDKFLIINVGEIAPDFVAKAVDGKTIKLSELRGKVVLLDFWATWCGPCVAEIPNIKKAYKKYGKGQDFVVVGISVDNDASAVRRFMTKHGMAWPQIALGPAEQNPVAKSYHVTGVPSTFLLDRNGKVVAKDFQGLKLEYELKKLFPGPLAQASGGP